MTNKRNQAIHRWLADCLSTYDALRPLVGDASFRRYFRLHSKGVNYVLMDLPPQKESCSPFIAIDQAFAQADLTVPTVYYSDLEQGFILLSDLGDTQLLSELSERTVDAYYRTALEDLLTLQHCQYFGDYALPLYDQALYQNELVLFQDWYLKRHLGISLSASDQQAFNRIYRQLIDSALSQPQVCVHRDYHSRNLMVLPNQRLGILDFQDAVWGPITYDLVSLLRDCYIAWSDEQVRGWSLIFQRRLLETGRLDRDDPDQFLQWCDWMALQRHLKCIGIFSRLNYRDNKVDYMKDIPRVLSYAQLIVRRYPEFSALEKFL